MKKRDVKNGICLLLLAGLLGSLCGCGAGSAEQSGGMTAERDGGSGYGGDGNSAGTGAGSAGEGSDTGAGTGAGAVGEGNGTRAVSGQAENRNGMGTAVVSTREGDAAETGSETVGEGSSAGAAEAGGMQGSGGNDAQASGRSEKRRTEEKKQDGAAAVTDFGLRLLRQCGEAAAVFPSWASMPQDIAWQTGMGGNILVSPLSVITALTMTAEGAEGETRAQMEDVFGMSVPELADYLSALLERLPQEEKYKLGMANGIWFTEDERFTVEEDFLLENERRFGAGINRVPFDDSAVREINGWVKENTDGMIDGILDEIPPDAVMYLVNALAFDARWQEIYYDDQVREGTFTKAEGTVQDVEMMYSTESWYLEDAHAEGFLKEYADGKYVFAALLPEEGMTVQEYICSLNGTVLNEILSKAQSGQVSAAIPKYKSEYSIEMSRVLQAMGMEAAFDCNKADFSGIGRSLAGNIYIDRVLHKTFAAVDEEGTRAGAATAVEMKDECAMADPSEVKYVYLDRPFMYMILDREENVPVFLGIVEEVD